MSRSTHMNGLSFKVILQSLSEVPLGNMAYKQELLSDSSVLVGQHSYLYNECRKHLHTSSNDTEKKINVRLYLAHK